MNFKFLISNFKLPKVGLLMAVSLWLMAGVFVATVHADAVTDPALDFLKSKQDVTGEITGGGFSNASSWSAIAFGAYGVDIATVASPGASLKDYLIDKAPTISSPAFEWEKWILAIVASGYNPYDFAGVDYVATLQSSTYYTANQIGDTSGVNDDFFGVMALIASKVDVSGPALTDGVSFIITNQNGDGGWGYAPGVESDTNDASAAIQALVAAKEYGVSNADLDSAITNAKTYLLSMQDASGGFFYDTMPWTTAPDTDSTLLSLMALNVLGMQDSEEANLARVWLLDQQDPTGGFISWGSTNSTTTAQALIALADKGFIVKIFDPSNSEEQEPVPTVNPTATPTPTSAPSNNSSSTPTPTPTPTPSSSTTTLASILNNPLAESEEEDKDVLAQITSIPEGNVLAATDTKSDNKGKGIVIAGIFAGIGLIFVFIYLAKPFIIRKFK